MAAHPENDIFGLDYIKNRLTSSIFTKIIPHEYYTYSFQYLL